VANIRLHEQQEQLVKMERMALVGRITSSVAHSIRNPLMVIGGFARSLLKGNGDEGQRRQKLDSIVGEVRHLENVLEEALAYAESQYPVMDQWDMTSLMEGVAADVRGELDRRGVSLALDLRQGLPAVSMDFKQIAYCIKTLILHSLSLSEGGGEIRMADRLFDEALFVEILDRRYTLPPEQLEALLPAFSETEDMGRAAGLQLCRIILERHGCDFHILSLPEGGTLHTLRFPVAKEGVHEQDSGGR
jgi:signal transduction histidine kinase